MDKLFCTFPKLLIAGIIAAALIFAALSLGMLKPMQEGADIGEISELCDGWSYAVNGGESRKTALPATLPLPENARQLTLQTTLPESIENGDVLRFQTLLGWYKIYINDELRLSYGNEEITERYLLENASNMLLVKLTDEDAGGALRVETGYELSNYLAQQRAPTISGHRDLLMQDIIGSSSEMLIIFILIISSLLLLTLGLLFRLRHQPKPVLAGCAVFILMGAAYYNVGNMFQCELWGYPKNLPMYNDFIYYLMEFLIPVVGYQLVLGAIKEKPHKALGGFILAHTLFAFTVMALQMLWIGNMDIFEYIGAIATVIGYVWLWLALKPTKCSPEERKLCLPVFLCILAFLMDYYKNVGTWWPMPESWVTFLQVELPFMAFFPSAMLILVLMTLLALVDMLVGERVALKVQAETAQFTAFLTEREFHSTLENISQIRQVRHDFIHHLTTLSAIAEKGRKDELLSYISSMSELVPSHPLSEHNFITSSFIEYYRELCNDAGIRFEAVIRYNEDLCQNKTHLGILLGNSLKNAYEAALESNDAERFVSVEGRQHHQQLILIVKNSFSGKLDEKYSSTKGEGRGLGLAGIRNVTECHNGYLELGHIDTVFTLKAVLSAT